MRTELTVLLRYPAAIAWQLGTPVMFVLLFVYVFGSAMEVGGGADYQDYALPGMFAVSMANGFMNTAVAVAAARERGVMDRYRSMPMAPSAVVSGRGVADVIGASVDLAVLAAIALTVGWRPDGGPLATLGAFALLILLRSALIWVGVYLGLLVPTQEAAGNLFAVAFPLGMISSVFTPPAMMPDWLGAIALWNPRLLHRERDPRPVRQPVPGGGGWVEGTHADGGGVRWPHGGVPPPAVRRFPAEPLSR
uniref:Putative ABC transporter n=1 Tax=Streptomyces sparsogenes TaxID=67365 RepID=I0DFX0_9ACTN|nr:putative ABC transporter [Streptomyces sparsogenes]